MKINCTRVIVGGLLAGLIVNICQSLVSGLVLSSQWTAAMKSLNRPSQLGVVANLAFWLWGFLIGIYALWLYATIRPRYGPGPKTAVIAGVAVWVPASLLAMIPVAAMHLYRYRLIAADVVLGLVAIVAGTVAGAWLYKEPEIPAATPAAGVAL